MTVFSSYFYFVAIKSGLHDDLSKAKTNLSPQSVPRKNFPPPQPTFKKTFTEWTRIEGLDLMKDQCPHFGLIFEDLKSCNSLLESATMGYIDRFSGVMTTHEGEGKNLTT